MNTKEAVRRSCKSVRAALSIEDCERWTTSLTEQITLNPQYQSAKTVMAYLAMPKEANLDGVIRHALTCGKSVYVPVCVDKTTMIAVRLQSLEVVTRGVLGIRIPPEPYDIIQPDDLDLIFVPGAGFDRYGGRMGMGNGYYDRFLEGLSPSSYIGVCWSAQLSDTPIPMDEHDCRVEQIITEQGIVHCVQ